MKKYSFILGMVLSLFFVSSAEAALKNNGDQCSRSSECKSGLCREGYLGLVCAGPRDVGQSCSITDQNQGCLPGLLCNGDSFICETDTRTPSAGNNGNSGTSTANTNTGAVISNTTCGPTEFCNPIAFTSVEGFLTHILSYLQKIIVVLSLLFILVGAVLYITSAGVPGQIEKAKKAITASLIGLAIGIAAPSFLKEISLILGWTEVNNAQVAGALTLTQIALNIVKFLLSAIGILALLMMIVGATFYVTAAGDEDQIKKGKAIFKYAVLGIIMAMVSMVIIKQVALLLAK